jgi:hypothetical protein
MSNAIPTREKGNELKNANNPITLAVTMKSATRLG